MGIDDNYYQNYGGDQSGTSDWEDYQAQVAQNRRNVFGGNTGRDVARSIVGGPVGWFEAAQGKGLLGGMDPFDGTSLNQEMTEEVYNSMSPAEWASFRKMNGREQVNFIKSRTNKLARDKVAFDAKKKEADALELERNNRKAQQDDIIKKVQAFAKEMNMPVDELIKHDAFAQALRSTTLGGAMADMNNRGLGVGGISNQNADLMSKKALLGYQMQRQQMGQQAYGQAYGMLNNQGLQAEDLRRYNQGLDLQMQGLAASARNQQYMQELGQQQGFGSLVGGIIGGAYGGPQGAALGSSIGGSAAGVRYQSNNPYQPYQYNYPSGGMSSGRGYGGGNY